MMFMFQGDSIFSISPMVPAYFILMLLLLFLFYHISTGNDQFATTASVIQEIWSGRCRACMESMHAFRGYGLSGVINTNEASNLVGTSHGHECICNSCPCALVQSWIKKCSPIRSYFQDIVHAMVQIITNMFIALEDLYDEYSRVMLCRGTCQTEDEILQNDYTSPEHFGYSNLETVPKQSNANLEVRKSSIAFRIEPGSKIEELSFPPAPTNDTLKTINDPDETLKPTSETVSASFCSKCKQMDKTCGNDCTKSKIN